MTLPLTHASFFSGAGGLDLGLARAGWQTVSLSEVDRYANTLLAERFAGVPNLGDITTIDPEDIPDATLWSGGFPCQDLSRAGQRRGFGGDRSVLAFAFLDLVERRRPPWFVLENVDGLLTSNAGKDLARLVSEVDGLGYGLAWRVLDAQWFGVAQRRRRVYLVASRDSDRAGAVLLEPEVGVGHPPAIVEARTLAARSARVSSGGDSIAGAVTAKWAKGSGGPAGDEAYNLLVVAAPRTTRSIDDRGDVAGGLVVGSASDATRVRAASGLAGRLDHRERVASEIASALTRRIGGTGPDVADAQAGWLVVADVAGPLQATSESGGGRRVDADGAPTHLIVAGLGSDGAHRIPSDIAPTLRSGGGGQGDTIPVVAFAKSRNAATDQDDETWREATGDVARTLNTFGGQSDARAEALALGTAVAEDSLLPLGFDTHRYRLTGNGVAAPVVAWLGRRLRLEVEGALP